MGMFDPNVDRAIDGETRAYLAKVQALIAALPSAQLRPASSGANLLDTSLQSLVRTINVRPDATAGDVPAALAHSVGILLWGQRDRANMRAAFIDWVDQIIAELDADTTPMGQA